MAFVLKQSDSYVWPVTVEIPIDGGRFDRQTFDAEFKRLPQARNNAIVAAAKAEATTDLEVADEVLVGWKGIADDAGEDVPYSETAKAQLLDVPGVSAALVEAYLKSLIGAKRKN
jgi:hypothetical protein